MYATWILKTIDHHTLCHMLWTTQRNFMMFGNNLSNENAASQTNKNSFLKVVLNRFLLSFKLIFLPWTWLHSLILIRAKGHLPSLSSHLPREQVFKQWLVSEWTPRGSPCLATIFTFSHLLYPEKQALVEGKQTSLRSLSPLTDGAVRSDLSPFRVVLQQLKFPFGWFPSWKLFSNT